MTCHALYAGNVLGGNDCGLILPISRERTQQIHHSVLHRDVDELACHPRQFAELVADYLSDSGVAIIYRTAMARQSGERLHQIRPADDPDYGAALDDGNA